MEHEPADGGSDEGWPPGFPHVEIDELLTRLREADTADPETLTTLLAQISREAQRLRSTTSRLSVRRLAAANEQARAIIAEALEQATSLRRLGLEALDDRLDEADRITASMRALLRVEEATAWARLDEMTRSDAERAGPGWPA